MTTQQCCSLYPFQAETGLGPRRARRHDLAVGALYYYDPFALYSDGALDNPNVMVFGETGKRQVAPP